MPTGPVIATYLPAPGGFDAYVRALAHLHQCQTEPRVYGRKFRDQGQASSHRLDGLSEGDSKRSLF
jgi:hypothetical protein